MNYGELQNLSDRIQNHPRDFEAYFSRGKLLEAHGFLDDSKNDYSKAIKLNPKHFQAYKNTRALYFWKIKQIRQKKLRISIILIQDKFHQNRFLHLKVTFIFTLVFPIISSIGKIEIEDYEQPRESEEVQNRIPDNKITIFQKKQQKNSKQNNNQNELDQILNDDQNYLQPDNSPILANDVQQSQIEINQQQQSNENYQQAHNESFYQLIPEQFNQDIYKKAQEIQNSIQDQTPILQDIESFNKYIKRVQNNLEFPIQVKNQLIIDGVKQLIQSNSSKAPDDGDGEPRNNQDDNLAFYQKTFLWEVYNYLGVCYCLLKDQDFLNQKQGKIGLQSVKKAVETVQVLGKQAKDYFDFKANDFLNMNQILSTLTKDDRTRFQEILKNFKRLAGNFEDLQDLFELVKIISRQYQQKNQEGEKQDKIDPQLINLAERFLKRKIKQNPQFKEYLSEQAVIHGISLLKTLEDVFQFKIKDLPELVKEIINKGADILKEFLIQKFKEQSKFLYYCCCFCCYYCCCCCCCLPQSFEQIVDKLSSKFIFDDCK